MNKMKSIFAMFAITLSFSTQAQKMSPAVCNDLQELAYKIMDLRQSGIPASQVIAVADGNKIVHSIIISAYEEYQYSTRDYQIRASKEFANKVYIECFKAVSSK